MRGVPVGADPHAFGEQRGQQALPAAAATLAGEIEQPVPDARPRLGRSGKG
jgi:hypothetical protein